MNIGKKLMNCNRMNFCKPKVMVHAYWCVGLSRHLILRYRLYRAHDPSSKFHLRTGSPVQVDIRFGAPGADGEQNRNLVVISGKEEDCFDCRDHLLNMEEEFLQDIADEVRGLLLLCPNS